MKRKQIAVIDPFSGGHHQAFAVLFAKHLIELGYKVTVLIPNVFEVVGQELKKYGFGENDFKVAPFEIAEKKTFLLHKQINVLSMWWEANRQVRLHGFKPGQGVVYFAWLDSFLAHRVPVFLIDLLFRFKWSGLYFHPWYLYGSLKNVAKWSDQDGCFLSKNCLSIGVHDNFLGQKLSERVKKPVIEFPEMADSTPPSFSNQTYLQIKKSASGRPVIGVIGQENRKGLVLMMRLAKLSDPGQYFFYFGGTYISKSLSPVHANEFEEFKKAAPVNCMFADQYLSEGEIVNSVISSFDAIFLVYKNFKSSSNFLTKAVQQKKLVLATDRFWLGANTKKYNLGKVTNEDDPENAMLMLNELFATPITPDYEGYMSKNSEDKLKESFQNSFLGNDF